MWKLAIVISSLMICMITTLLMGDVLALEQGCFEPCIINCGKVCEGNPVCMVECEGNCSSTCGNQTESTPIHSAISTPGAQEHSGLMATVGEILSLLKGLLNTIIQVVSGAENIIPEGIFGN